MADRNQPQRNQPATGGEDAAPAFPNPTPVEAPPVGARKANPALPVVKNAVGKGWQRFESANEKDATKQRQLVSRAGAQLNVKARTRTHKDSVTGKMNPLIWYMLVERKDDTHTSDSTG